MFFLHFRVREFQGRVAGPEKVRYVSPDNNIAVACGYLSLINALFVDDKHLLLGWRQRVSPHGPTTRLDGRPGSLGARRLFGYIINGCSAVQVSAVEPRLGTAYVDMRYEECRMIVLTRVWYVYSSAQLGDWYFRKHMKP